MIIPKNKERFVCPHCESKNTEPDEELAGCYVCNDCCSSWSEDETDWWAINGEGKII